MLIVGKPVENGRSPATYFILLRAAAMTNANRRGRDSPKLATSRNYLDARFYILSESSFRVPLASVIANFAGPHIDTA
ncbi:MAG: hypothetical protein WD875_18800, partial [Pirellulales bacterium]